MSSCVEEWRSEMQEELEQARNLLEIHWSEHHVPWHCIRVQADILHRFCFSEAFAVKACGWCRRASFFILGFDVVHAFKWRAFLMVCPPRNGRVKVMSTWCLLLNAKPSRIFESKFRATWGSSAGRFLRTFFCQASDVVSLCRSGRCWNWMTWAWNAGSICGSKPPGEYHGISMDILLPSTSRVGLNTRARGIKPVGGWALWPTWVKFARSKLRVIMGKMAPEGDQKHIVLLTKHRQFYPQGEKIMPVRQRGTTMLIHQAQAALASWQSQPRFRWYHIDHMMTILGKLECKVHLQEEQRPGHQVQQHPRSITKSSAAGMKSQKCQHSPDHKISQQQAEVHNSSEASRTTGRAPSKKEHHKVLRLYRETRMSKNKASRIAVEFRLVSNTSKNWHHHIHGKGLSSEEVETKVRSIATWLNSATLSKEVARTAHAHGSSERGKTRRHWKCDVGMVKH